MVIKDRAVVRKGGKSPFYSLERAVPAPWAVPAAPLLGCTSGKASPAWRAAQFNR
jgi:hypothetical protein